MSRARTSSRNWVVELVRDDLLAAWADHAASRGFVAARATRRFFPERGQVLITQSYRGADGSRMIVRVILPWQRG